jgi:hypothetical protein
MRALENHPKLRGIFQRDDPRFVAVAGDLDYHNGYSRWHVQLDDRVVEWIEGNRRATPEVFLQELEREYSQPAMRVRFPLYSIPTKP